MGTAAVSETPHLTEQYYKARKSLALFSGLLFAWEFVGLEITPKPFQDIDLTLKSPQATPYVLLALSVYFLIRLLTEWYQSSAERRANRASRVDLGLSLSIPTIAVLTFSVQRALEIQIANIASLSGLLGGAGGTLISLGLTYPHLRRPVLGFRHPLPKPLRITLLGSMVMGVTFIGLAVYRGPLVHAVVGSIVGMIVVPPPALLVVAKQRVNIQRVVDWLRGSEREAKSEADGS